MASRLNSIQVKVGGFLALILVLAFGISTAINTLQSTSLLKASGQEALSALRAATEDQARSVFYSLEISTDNSVAEGRMDVFQEMINDLGNVPGVIEVGLTDPRGKIDYSNVRASLGGQFPVADRVAGETQPIIFSEAGDVLTLSRLSILEPQCLECHFDAKPGDVGGVLFARLSLEGLRNIENSMVAALGEARTTSISTGLLTGGGGLLLAAIAVVVLLGRMVRAPLVKLVAMMEELGRGHLGKRLNIDKDDEIGQMAKAIDSFADTLEKDIVANMKKLAAGDLDFTVVPYDGQDEIRSSLRKVSDDLNAMMGEVQSTGDQIARGADQVADTSQSLSQGATEQASSLEEISASINEMAAQIKQSADNAGQADGLSRQARDSAARGQQQMQAMVGAMSEINRAGADISKIIKVIDEIAFQTNLLALNAAVEAARAGQHGKGFAVVAEEVRNLAARSAKAAKETAELIEVSVDKAKNGGEIADHTAAALDEIVSGVTKVSDLIGEISAAATEQAGGISQINQGLSQIDQVTQQNTANAEESAAAAEELSGQVQQMRGMLQRFHLRGGATVRAGLPSPVEPRHHANTRSAPSTPEWGGAAAAKPASAKGQGQSLIALDDEEFGRY